MSDSSPGGALQPLTIKRKQPLAEGIWRFELVARDNQPLPAFTAGSHIAVRTPSGAKRHYSLSNDPAETDRYELGVKVEPQGRGGSTSLVEDTREGGELMVSAPMNTFALEPAPGYILIAGGIGITPILSMARQLRREAAAFQLVYCARNAEVTAFGDELSEPDFAAHVTVHHDDGDPGRMYDFWDLFERPGKAHVYCCGPRPLMEEILGVSGHWPHGAIHFEDFATDVNPVRPDDRCFTVRRHSTGQCFPVPSDHTILETLRAAGEMLPSSCESGTCGTCRTRVVEGAVDHRDRVLSDEQRRHDIMICVSRALGDELVLDW